MVDIEDLKSSDHCDRAGSSPVLGTKGDMYKYQHGQLKYAGFYFF